MLLQKLKQEHLFDYIGEIINSKEISDKKDFYHQDCLYISRDDFNFQDSLKIYDESGDLFLNISPPLVNEYSQEDYLVNYNLLEDLEEKIQELIECDFIILTDC